MKIILYLNLIPHSAGGRSMFKKILTLWFFVACAFPVFAQTQSSRLIKVQGNNPKAAKKYNNLEVRCSKIHEPPQSLSVQGEKLEMPIDWISEPPYPISVVLSNDTLRLHPALAEGDNGRLVMGYNYYDQSVGDTVIYWYGSSDGGATWTTRLRWTFSGVEKYPSVSYWGSGSTFYGTLVTPPEISNGGPVYRVNFPDATNPLSWTLWSWNYSTSGWRNMKMASIACDNGGESWEFGFMSLIHTHDPDTANNAPCIFYVTNAGGSGHMSWYPTMDGCEHTSAAIDHATKKTYAVYDWYSPTDHRWELFIDQRRFSDWDGPQNSDIWYFNNPHLHIKSPVVTAHNDTLVILTEVYNDSFPSDLDIISWYNFHGNIDSLNLSVVAGSDHRECRPTISSFGADSFLCSYLIDDSLCVSVSLEGGASWWGPYRVSSDTQSVVDEYRTADIAEGSSKLLWEYKVGGSNNIYLGSKGFATRPGVVALSPPSNDLNAPINSNMSATFDTNMDANTINDSTFIVDGRSTGRHQGTISYDFPSRTAAFDPSSNFAAGEVATATLTYHIQSPDGRPLLSFVWSFNTEVKHGTTVFQLDSLHSVGDGPHDVFAADLDGDNDPDLVIPNENSDNVAVLLNDGDGAFAVDSFYAVGDSPLRVFAADLDGDGDLDLTTANYLSNNVSVLLNNGDGTFSPHSVYSVGTNPRSVFACDLNGDGHLDLAVPNENSANVSILINNGNGTFTPYSVFTVRGHPHYLYASDFDEDGDFDLAIANPDSDKVSVLWNNGNGAFWPHTFYSVGDGPQSLFCADLDGDGDADIATANNLSDNVSVLLNNGNRVFSSPSDFAVGDGPTSIFGADLDADGDIDLVTANGNSDNISLLLNNGDGTFAPHVVLPAGDYPFAVFVADLEGDGDLDLTTANRNSDNLSILLNFLRGDCNGDGVIALGDVVYLITYLYKNGPAPIPLQAGDLNCNGVVDLGDVVYIITYLYKAGPPPPC
jgi:hypothetical protein